MPEMSRSLGSTAIVTAPPSVPVKVDIPLSEPYRTGAYLIFDIPPGTEDRNANFRSGQPLKEHPYPASGSHQLNAQQLADILKSNVVTPHQPSRIFLVDLRQETHGFFDGVAVSWYA